MEGINIHLNNSEVVKKYDFRKLGKPRMDAVLHLYDKRDDPIFQFYMDSVEHSRSKERASEKFRKKVEQYYQINM